MARKKFDRSLLPPSPTLAFEKNLWRRGVRFVAGVDEAGRGALAGPVAAAAVVLPHDFDDLIDVLKGVRDSKEMSEPKRETWAQTIRTEARAFGLGFASPKEIDAYGIIPATHLAIRRALLALKPFPDHLLIDALTLKEIPVPQTALIKGDARCLSIAAASVLAKTGRDARMRELGKEHPEYGFTTNKGYGTAKHISAIEAHGPTSFHRMSFAPLRIDSQLELEFS